MAAVLLPLVMLLHLTMFILCVMKTFSASFGRLKNRRRTHQLSHSRSVWSFKILRQVIIVQKAGRFVVPLPRKPDGRPIGESRSQAVWRFIALEHSLPHRNKFQELNDVMQEYLALGHAEAVPIKDLDKDPSMVLYLPMHVVQKSSSSTTKVRAVFDAYAKSASGVSLNDTLLAGLTVHPPLIDVLLRFWMHRVALTTDVSKMY